MAIDSLREEKSADRAAFEHYLRTGQRLTTAEWKALRERKFNPYHDELGRFTSPPGVTTSWGKRDLGENQSQGRGEVQSRPAERAANRTNPQPVGPTPQDSARRVQGTSRFRSERVRDVVRFGTYVHSYRELNVLQAQFDAFKATLPHPTDDEKADLAKIQAGYDANRRWLDEGGRAGDREVVEILRAGNSPLDSGLDIGAASFNIATGEGDLGDGITLATSLPLLKPIKLVGRTLARSVRISGQFATSKVTKDTVHVVINGTIQRGGAHRHVTGILGHDAHHIPPKAASPLSMGDGPTIAMERADHRALKSSRNHKAHLDEQKRLVKNGEFRAAMDIEIADIKELFGQKYDDAIEQMLSYSRSMGVIK